MIPGCYGDILCGDDVLLEEEEEETTILSLFFLTKETVFFQLLLCSLRLCISTAIITILLYWAEAVA